MTSLSILNYIGQQSMTLAEVKSLSLEYTCLISSSGQTTSNELHIRFACKQHMNFHD